MDCSRDSGIRDFIQNLGFCFFSTIRIIIYFGAQGSPLVRPSMIDTWI